MKNFLLLIFLSSWFNLIDLKSQVIISENFETWEDLGDGYTQPEGWFSSNAFDALFGDNQGILQSNDSYEGQYAARMRAYFTIEPDPVGSFMNLNAPINENPEMISGWYKHLLVNDTVILIAPCFAYDVENDTSTSVGTVNIEFSGLVEDYTYFSSPFTFQQSATADTIRLLIAFSDIVLSGESTFTIDNIKIESSSSLSELSGFSIPCYPNPAEGRVSYYLPQNLKSASLCLTNALGQVFFSLNQDLSQGTHQLSLEGLPAGIYHLNIKDEDGFTGNSRIIHID
jgi:hypothetical protein